jgi:hypothetical protein
MQAHADPLPLAPERVGEPRWRRQAVAQSVQDRRNLPESDTREIGDDAYRPYDHRGLVVVASAWLAFYVFATIHDFIALGN